MSHDKSSPNLHFSDHPTDVNSLNYLRQAQHAHKTQTSHPSPHRSHHPNTSSRQLIAPILNSQIPPHHSSYLMHGHHHSQLDTGSSQRQQQSPHHYVSPYSQPSSQQRISDHSESVKSTKESISIQDFMNKSVHDFVSSTSK